MLIIKSAQLERERFPSQTLKVLQTANETAFIMNKNYNHLISLLSLLILKALNALKKQISYFKPQRLFSPTLNMRRLFRDCNRRLI